MNSKRLLIKNIAVSILILILFLLEIFQQYGNLTSEIYIAGTGVYYFNIICAIYVLILFAYLMGSNYTFVLSSERFTKHSLHMILNIIVLNIMSISLLVMTNSLTIWIGLVTIVLQIIYFMLYMYLKGQHDMVKINNNLLQISNICLFVLLFSTCLSNLPFSIYILPLNIIAIVSYVLILIYNLYQMYQTFFK